MIKKYSVKLLVIIILEFFIMLNCKAAERQCVILLHGLGRSHYSMSSIESMLKRHNYFVVNENYPSTKKSIESIANQYIPLMVDECLMKHSDHINFITHSMGGIVLREYLQNHEIPKLSHIVMLGPPNHGSQLADLLHNNWLFKLVTGPAGQELTTEKTSIPNTLNHFNSQYQLGIIAGNFSFTPFNQFIFHEKNDGKVAVSSAKLNSMKDFIVLPVSHTFMMNNALVQQQILHFLHYGKFIH
ncbi:MAG: alpha/beta hydrolase [Gammaproteobacteria bacterium]|nr:alpha/beta hydrolase [Gammaproteobacteria bacterium]